MVRQNVDSIVPEVWRVSQRGRYKLPTRSWLQHLSSVHVPSTKESIFASEAGREFYETHLDMFQPVRILT